MLSELTLPRAYRNSFGVGPPSHLLPTYRFWSWAVVAMIVAGAMCRRCVAKSKSKGTVLNGHQISSLGCALFEGVVMLLLCQLQILTKKRRGSNDTLSIPNRYPIDTSRCTT